MRFLTTLLKILSILNGTRYTARSIARRSGYRAVRRIFR